MRRDEGGKEGRGRKQEMRRDEGGKEGRGRKQGGKEGRGRKQEMRATLSSLSFPLVAGGMRVSSETRLMLYPNYTPTKG